MSKLKIQRPKRLFTFGCSFTHYRWASWANILGYEFDCEFYNLGKSGAGNSFIANQVTQANNYFRFTESDLVVICWTNISREDRWHSSKGWITPGNIYSQGEYDKKFVKDWANDIHFALRDFSTIDLIKNYLEDKTNFHFLSMCNIVKHVNQWENCEENNNSKLLRVSDTYQSALSKINPSFYEVLWQNDINNKWHKDWNNIHPNFSDGHPTIEEHFEYLESTFDYRFSDITRAKVKETNNDLTRFIKKEYNKTRRSKGIHDMPQDWQHKMFTKFRLKKELPLPGNIFY